MANFPGNTGVYDELAFRGAVEAIVGLSLKGGPPTMENVRGWIETSMDPNVPNRSVQGRAIYFAQRMVDGPFRPDGSEV